MVFFPFLVMALNVHLNACNVTTVDNRAYIDTAFFTQNYS